MLIEMSDAMATRSRHGLLLDLVNLRRELRCRVKVREIAGKETSHLLRHLRRIEAAISAGEFLEKN